MRRTLAFVSMIAALLASATAGPSSRLHWPECGDLQTKARFAHVLLHDDNGRMAKMVGLFGDFGGNISFDANNVATSKLNVTIEIDS